MNAVGADQQGPGDRSPVDETDDNAVLRLGDLRHRCAEMDRGRIGSADRLDERHLKVARWNIK